MDTEKSMIRVFTGTEVQVNILKTELEKEGIYGIIKNDFGSGVFAGFGGGLPSGIDLFINEYDLKKAEPVIKDFTRINNV